MSGEPKQDRKANRRGAARLAAVQALYQMDIAGTDLSDILAELKVIASAARSMATSICRPMRCCSARSCAALSPISVRSIR